MKHHTAGHSDLLQQLVVCEAEGFLQQDGQHHAEDEKTFLLRRAVLITDLNRDEPHQRRQQQRHQPEKRSEGETNKNIHQLVCEKLREQAGKTFIKLWH